MIARRISQAGGKLILGILANPTKVETAASSQLNSKPGSFSDVLMEFKYCYDNDDRSQFFFIGNRESFHGYNHTMFERTNYT